MYHHIDITVLFWGMDVYNQVSILHQTFVEKWQIMSNLILLNCPTFMCLSLYSFSSSLKRSKCGDRAMFYNMFLSVHGHKTFFIVVGIEVYYCLQIMMSDD